MHLAPERPPRPAAAGEALSPAALFHLRAMARFVEPWVARVRRAFLRELTARGCDPAWRRALCAIAPAEACAMIAAGRSLPAFLDEVQFNGRNLARLNAPPSDAVDALRRADLLLGRLTGSRFHPAREQLHLATVLALNNAYFDVREAETQAFFGLLMAETEAQDIPDLLRRFARILAKAFHARAASLSVPDRGAHPSRSEPRYYREARRLEDERLRCIGDSGWSFPIPVDGKSEGAIELVFSGRRRWLPREAELLRASAALCGRAIQRARLLEQVVRLGAAARRAEEEERRRIGRELHDDTAQSLLTLRLRMEMLERDLPLEIRRRIGDVREQVERTIVDLRRVIAALSPANLERLGLHAALRHLCDRLSRHGPAIRARIGEIDGTVPTPLAEATYRIAQECLRNAARHSQATHVNLSVRMTDNLLELRVADNGVGFDAEGAVRRPMSFGLAGMRERAGSAGGTLRIRSSPGKGSVVRFTAPIRASTEETEPDA